MVGPVDEHDGLEVDAGVCRAERPQLTEEAICSARGDDEHTDRWGFVSGRSRQHCAASCSHRDHGAGVDLFDREPDTAEGMLELVSRPGVRIGFFLACLTEPSSPEQEPAELSGRSLGEQLPDGCEVRHFEAQTPAVAQDTRPLAQDRARTVVADRGEHVFGHKPVQARGPERQGAGIHDIAGGSRPCPVAEVPVQGRSPPGQPDGLGTARQELGELG